MQKSSETAIHQPDAAKVFRQIDKRSFATLATVSNADRPHVAGVLYELHDKALYVNTLETSRKGRNLAANPHVGVAIPIRRVPVGPPSSVQFQGTVEMLAVDDPAIVRLIEAGKLRSITGHGELDLPGSVFVRIALPPRIHTYGLGMSLRRLIADPLNAAGTVDLSRL